MRRLRILCTTLALFALLSTAGSDPAWAEARVALVIGIGAYQNAPHLANPPNDAHAIAEAFRTLGFAVDEHVDLDNRSMAIALREFGVKAQRADIAVVFYAGHGLQVSRTNYLLPADARLERERDLVYEALPLDLFLGEVAQAKKLGIVILDACRNNPFAERLMRSSSRTVTASRSAFVQQGLARVDNTPSDTLVALATRADAVAEDGSSAHSPYTEALLAHLEIRGLELSLFFRKVRDAVLKTTDGRQEPFTYGSLGAEPFYFNPLPPNRLPVVAANAPIETTDTAGPVALNIVPPTDPDGDPVVARVTGLPRGGLIGVGGRTVLIGDILTPEQLGSATFLPDGSFVGNAGVFAFMAEDNRGGATAGSVYLRLLPSNHPPQVAEAERTLHAVANPLSIPAPTDPDGDRLAVTVTSVPARGIVRNGGTAVRPGDTLSVPTLTGLTYDPEPAFTGDAGRFEVSVDDGRGGQATTAVRVSVRMPDTAPTVAETQPPAATPPPALPSEAEPVLTRDEAQHAAAAQTRIVSLTPVAPPPEPPPAVAPEPAVGIFPGGPGGPGSDAKVFQDCPECPVMVRLEPGHFTMGVAKGDPSAAPAHKVTLAKPFALGKFEITVAEWQACVDAGACRNKPAMNNPDDHTPVHNLSWNDAQEYTVWLARRVGRPYRLPTEAEWEYAARAGTVTAYWWGEAFGSGRANCEDCGGPHNRKLPNPAGSYPANPFGLHDLNGGVAEWVADCWFPSHHGAPSDGSARSKDNCRQRVLRGGSWRHDHSYATAWSRMMYDADVRYFAHGFRVAVDLE